MKIDVYNVYAKVYDVDINVLYQLNSLLSYNKITFMQKPEQVFLLNYNNGVTYSGLVPRIVDFANFNNIKVEINDKRIKPEKNINFNLNIKLYDYQASIVNQINNREIIQAATGAGKTAIIAGLITKFGVSPVVIVSPKVSLAVQLQKEIGKFLGINVGIYHGKEKNIKDITVVSADSADELVMNDAKAVFWDECHSIPSFTVFNISKIAKNAYYRIGCSATPWRDYGDDLLIESALNKQKITRKITASTLIEQKKLVPCDIKFITVNNNFKWMGNYSDTYYNAIVYNSIRNNIIVNLVNQHYAKNDYILVLVNRIKHGEVLLNSFKLMIPLQTRTYFVNNNAYKINNIMFVNGNDGLDMRTAVFNAVNDGFCKVLIGTTIADEGLDLPRLGVLILAGAGKSSTKAYQRIGRVLRKYEGKAKAQVYDFYDQSNPFKEQAIKRYNLYLKEKMWNIA